MTQCVKRKRLSGNQETYLWNRLSVPGVLLSALLRQSISLLSAARWKPDKNIVAVFIPLNPANQTALFGKTKKRENETKRNKKYKKRRRKKKVSIRPLTLVC